MLLIPRMVGFDTEGKAVGAGFSSVVEQAHSHRVISLPGAHPDFIDHDVVGKTEDQIRAEISQSMDKCRNEYADPRLALCPEATVWPPC